MAHLSVSEQHPLTDIESRRIIDRQEICLCFGDQFTPGGCSVYLDIDEAEKLLAELPEAITEAKQALKGRTMSTENETAVEAQIQAKGLTAPRLTPEDIDAAIIDETFTITPSGKCTICELTLRNGFTVRGESAVVSLANFDAEIGQRISRENARKQVWLLEGYRLQQVLSENAPAHFDAATVGTKTPYTMSADVFGNESGLSDRLRQQIHFLTENQTKIAEALFIWDLHAALKIIERSSTPA